MPIWKVDSLKRCPNFIDLLGCIFAKNRDPELFSTIVWFLWNQRNNLRLGKGSIPLDQVLQQARNKLQEFKSAQTRTGAASTRHSSSQWQPPPSSVCKINFDSALFMKEQRAGIGVAIQNENGLIMVSSSQQIPLPGTVVEVEALATRKALELALDCGLDRVILEGDCEILMKTLQTASKSLAQFGKIAEDIRVYASMFQDISFSHVLRNCNSVAHSLVRRAILSPHFLVWMEDVPPDIEPIFQADLRSLP